MRDIELKKVLSKEQISSRKYQVSEIIYSNCYSTKLPRAFI